MFLLISFSSCVLLRLRELWNPTPWPFISFFHTSVFHHSPSLFFAPSYPFKSLSPPSLLRICPHCVSPGDSHPLTRAVCSCMSCLTALGPVSVSVWAVWVSWGMKGLFAPEVDEPLVRVSGGPEESRACDFIDILMWIVSFDLFNNLLIYHHHGRSLKNSDSISGSALCQKLCFLDIFCFFVSFSHHCGLWISLTKQTRSNAD